MGHRAACLKKFKKELSKRGADLAAAISRETGKVCWESKEEISLALAKIDLTIRLARDFAPKPSEAYTLYRPLGVAAVLGPFNFPIHLAHGHIVPALLAGNTVVFKPSDKACGTGRLYGACAKAAGFPPGVLNVVQGGGAVGSFLAAHPDVPAVLFTGSRAVGKRLETRCAGATEKILALEMGGKNAAVVFPDADMYLAAAECARAAFLTAGQRCTSTSRIFVHADRIDAFCGMFASLTKRFWVGDPFDPENFCGPVISEEAARRAESAVREARRLGGEPVAEGGRFNSDRGFFVRLSAHRFGRYPGRRRYTAEELFVPEVGIYPFKDPEEAVRLVEDTPYGLALAVFTQKRALFEKMLRETSHGVVNWNIGTVGASGSLPFGGRKQSGNARPAGAFAIRNCVSPVAVRAAHGRRR